MQPVGTALIHTDKQTEGRTHGQTDMAELKGTFRNSVEMFFK